MSEGNSGHVVSHERIRDAVDGEGEGLRGGARTRDAEGVPASPALDATTVVQQHAAHVRPTGHRLGLEARSIRRRPQRDVRHVPTELSERVDDLRVSRVVPNLADALDVSVVHDRTDRVHVAGDGSNDGLRLSEVHGSEIVGELVWIVPDGVVAIDPEPRLGALPPAHDVVPVRDGASVTPRATHHVAVERLGRARLRYVVRADESVRRRAVPLCGAGSEGEAREEGIP